MVMPHTQLGEDTGRGWLIHAPPTDDSPLVVDPAALLIAGTDLDERAGWRIRLSMIVITPACQPPIRVAFKPRVIADPARVKFARTDAVQARFREGTKLPVIIVAPANVELRGDTIEYTGMVAAHGQRLKLRLRYL